MCNIALPNRESYHGNTPDTTEGECYRKRKALAYASKGIPVFPLKPGGKTPLTEHGFKDATTDEDQIRQWWSKWPDANIGLPTGKRSGLLVLDVDPSEGGYNSLADLHFGEGHKLPETFMVRTGGNGQHYYFTFPDEEIRNSTGLLGPGLDIRGEGGYVVVPPSTTTKTYTVKKRLPLGPPPEWLLEKLRRSSRSPEKNIGSMSPLPVDTNLDGPPIPEGERNWTLYRIGCSLRSKRHDHSAILEALEEINRSRCSHPLDDNELEKIAKSAARHAPGKASPEVPAEVLESLDAIRAGWWRDTWRGTGGGSERDVLHATIELARLHGTMIPAGVRVSVDYRTVALMAGVGIGTVHRVISRLKVVGKIRTDNANRHRGEAGAFVLVATPREMEHSTTSDASIEPLDACVPPLAPPSKAPTTPRLRHSRPVFDGRERVGTIRRLGKKAGEVHDRLVAASGSMSLEELADAMGVKRPRDLRRNTPSYTGPVAKLEEAGVVECVQGVVRVTLDHLDALNRRREEDGEIADFYRDVKRYNDQREAYRNSQKQTPDQHPANVGADGYISELEKLSSAPSRERIMAYLDRWVDTVRGPGILWDFKGNEVRVVLDSDPTRWVPMDPSELVLSEVAA
jgi:hypothetical protein